MKSFNISTNSLHYRLAAVYGPASKYQIKIGTVDLCQYVRATFFGMLVVAALSAIGGGAIGLTLGDFGAWVVASIAAGHLLELGDGATMFLILCAVATALAAIFGFVVVVQKAVDARRERLENAPPKPYVEPGFVKAAYLQFKGKYCGRIEVSDGE